jgi:hypothetical protein
MVISALEDQRVTSILKMFAFTYSGIFWNFQIPYNLEHLIFRVYEIF